MTAARTHCVLSRWSIACSQAEESGQDIAEAGEFDLSNWNGRRNQNDRAGHGVEILPPAPRDLERGTDHAGSPNEPDYDLRSGYHTRAPQPQQPRSRILTGWAYAPATYILIG